MISFKNIGKRIFFIMAISFVLFTGGCLTTLQTARIRSGPGLTIGYQKLPFQYHEVTGVIIPSLGISAQKDRLGFSFSFPVLIEYNYEYGSWEGWNVSDEIKIQLPQNKWLDIAIGGDFWLYIPIERFLIISRGISRKLSLYGEIRNGDFPEFAGPDIISTKVTIGIEWNAFSHASILSDLSYWHTREDVEESANNMVFGIGVLLHE